MLSETSAPSIEGFSLSPQQKDLWPLQQRHPGWFRTRQIISVEGTFDRAAVQSALDQIVQRHEILRTTFEAAPGMTMPVQVINEEAVVEIQSVTQFSKESDLEGQTGVRIELLNSADGRQVMAISAPTICCDTASMNNLAQELVLILNGREAELPTEPMQYADFAAWQNDLLESDETAAGRAYWKNKTFPSNTSGKLPFEKNSSEQFVLRSEPIQFSPEKSARIGSLAEQLNVSVSAILLAAWQIVLARSTAQNEITVRCVFDGRKYPELKTGLGLYAKTLPIKLQLGETSFRETAAAVQRDMQQAAEWQECFFWNLLKEKQENFRAYAFEFDEHKPQASASYRSEKIHYCLSHIKVKASFSWANEALSGDLYYDATLFDAADIRMLIERLETLLQNAISDASTPVSNLAMVGAKERERILVSFNATKTDFPKGDSVLDLLREAFAQNSQKVAVACGGESLSYAELDRRSNQLANLLRKNGVKVEVAVGICVERSVEMIVGILAILKAGGAYVPLDPGYPQERLDFVLQEIQAPVLLTQKKFGDKLANASGKIICLDTDQTIAAESTVAPNVKLSEEDLAYVIFTSGSTGKPKGVLVNQKTLLHSTRARLKFYEQPVSGYLLVSSFAFDSSIAGIFWTLASGGTLVLPRETLQQDPLELVRLILQHRTSHFLSLPSLYSLILEQAEPEQLTSLRCVIVAGESCPQDLVGQHNRLLPLAALFNEYGPTEGTVWSSAIQLRPGELITIGKPIPNAQIYLLDAKLEPTPLGVPGEMFIGGSGIVRGYLNRPELTAEKFLPNTFNPASGARLYRTGDLARYLPDGRIEFLGRVDHQVKIRGYRIELEEIESVFKQNSAVRDVVVVARDQQPGRETNSNTEKNGKANPATQKRLVAYVVSKSPILVPELRSFLEKQLPDYMIPSAIVFLNSLPQTPNGKVDRNALPEPELATAQKVYVAPQSPVEIELARIWSAILKVEKIGRNDDFFELGGHSLLAIQIIARVRETFQIEIPLRAVFEAKNIAAFGESVVQAIAQSGKNNELDSILSELDTMTDEQAQQLVAAEKQTAAVK